MASAELTDGKPTNGANPWLDSLVWGGRWASDGAGPVTITYALSNDAPPDGVIDPDGTTFPWQATDIAAIQGAFSTWAAVANVEFVQADAGDANILYWLADNIAVGNDGTLAYHGVPGIDPLPLYAVFNGEDVSWTAGSLAQGGYAFNTLVHELGHGLGLAHPHDGGDASDATRFPGVGNNHLFGDYGNYDLNQGIFTVMTYNDAWDTQYPGFDAKDYGWSGTPMALDIAAVQLLYGANTDHNPTDSYLLPGADGAGTYWSCIWDTGGEDTLSAAGATGACVIDLEAAPLTGAHAGGYVSWVQGVHGGFTIANGVVIEDAVGGAGNDSITGNSVANSILGGSGNDFLQGLAGADRLFGGGGNDRLEGNTERDVLSGGAGADKFVFYSASTPSADTLKDFSPAQGDKIALDDTGFAAIGSALGGAEFRAGLNISAAGGARTVSQHILYDTDSGHLYYDADGSGTASSPVLVATLANHAVLTAADFQVI